MKNTRNKFLALILIATVAFFSCKKTDPLPSPNNTYPSTIQSTDNPTFTRGYWRVELFQKNGMDKANLLRGYLFTFNSNGIVNVLKDSSSVSGTWLTGQDNTALKKFVINFSFAPLNELNEEWHIKGETYSDLKLERLNVNGGSSDYLTFRRNQQE